MAFPVTAIRRECRKYDQITMHVPKGKRERLRAFALERGESLNTFLNRTINEAIQRNQPMR